MSVPIAIKTEGPFKVENKGGRFYLRVKIMKRYERLECADEPTEIIRDNVPPECSIRRVWDCRWVTYEDRIYQKIKAIEKPKGYFWWTGAILAVVGVVAIVIATGGGAILLFGSIQVAASTFITLGIAGAGAVGGGAALMRLDPDDYDMGGIEAEENKTEKISDREARSRTEFQQVQCD